MVRCFEPGANIEIAARYLDNVNDELVIREDSICLLGVFKDMKEQLQSDTQELRMSGRNLAGIILSKVRSLNLDPSKLIAQSYDGATSMSSEKVGVSAHVKEATPLALYFHCTVHALNLATSQVNQVDIRDAVDTIDSVIAI